MVYYPIPLHFQKAYQNNNYPKGVFPVAEDLCKRVLSLPIHTEMNEIELEYIIRSIKDFYKL